MAWIGGSFSSITDQISNFTRDILTEGTEEVSDHVTELKLSKAKINELESVVGTYKSEIERFKRISSELSERAESSELQIYRVSHEYRSLLQQKEKEFTEVKEKYNELIEHQTKSELLQPQSGSVFNQSPPIPLLSNTGEKSCNEDEFGDNISMQREINRLSHEIRHLHIQCDHWREIAQQCQNDEANKSPSSDDGGQISDGVLSLKSQLKQVQKQAARDKETHQQEIAALQDLHSQKLSSLREHHSQYVEELTTKVQDLEHALSLAAKTNEELSSERDKVWQLLRYSRFSLLDQLDTDHVLQSYNSSCYYFTRALRLYQSITKLVILSDNIICLV